MNVLVIGSGGREHAIVWKVLASNPSAKVYCAPGNAGIAQVAECVNIKADDIGRLADFAERNLIDLTIVGPEGPLTLGIVDRFEQLGLRAFGPRKNAAVIEGSKVFAKELMRKHGIPTAAFKVFTKDQALDANDYVRSLGKCVVKADGLAAGKGVFVCGSGEEAANAVREIMVEKKFGAAGDQLLVEELLEGEEVSVLAFCDGRTAKLMVSAQDHKRAFDDDEGPNTGGMGAYSPAPLLTPELARRVHAQVIVKTLEALAKEGRPFKGVLYAGLMVSGAQINVLEFNCRFGDPETQAILPRLDSDLVEVCNACLDGRLEGVELKWSEKASCCVVLTAKGYPGDYEKGKPIRGLDKAAALPDTFVFHAGTIKDGGNLIVSSGGRVLGVAALGKSIADAIARAYKAVALISFEGMHFRKDIGRRALERRAPEK